MCVYIDLHLSFFLSRLRWHLCGLSGLPHKQRLFPLCFRRAICLCFFCFCGPFFVVQRASMLSSFYHCVEYREHSTALHSTAQHSTAQRSTAQRSEAQRSTAQRSEAQRSTAQRNQLAQSSKATTCRSDCHNASKQTELATTSTCRLLIAFYTAR